MRTRTLKNEGLLIKLAIAVFAFFVAIAGIMTAKTIAHAEDAISENNMTYEYFSDTPQVYIETKDGKGNELNKEAGYVDTKITIVDTDGTILVEDSESSIKVRGNSTAAAEKKPYTFKLSSKQNIFGMGKSKKWILLANCFDPTLVRNSVAFELAHEMGLSYTTEFKYVDVWMDGVNKGSFLFVEQTEAGDTRVDIDETAGDFLLEFDIRDDEEEIYVKSPEYGYNFIVHYPEDDVDEAKLQVIKDKLAEADAALKSKDINEIGKVFDLDSFAKFILLVEYTKNVDVNTSSVYMYCKDGKLYAGPAWDFDLSCGNCKFETYPAYHNAEGSKNSAYKFGVNDGYLKLLRNIPEFRNLLLKLYKQYQSNFRNIYADGGYIDKTIATYNRSFTANYTTAGWDVAKRYSDTQMTPLATYEENVLFLKQWLAERNRWLGEELNIGENYDGIALPDVFPNEWYSRSVYSVYKAGIMTGYGESKGFGVNRNISREQFAAIIYRAAGSPAVDVKTSFKDVEAGKYYCSAVAWCEQNKIISGYADENGKATGIFGVGDFITRQQMAAILYRFAKFRGENVSAAADIKDFKDADKVSEYAIAPMKWCIAKGIINGKNVDNDMLLVPNGNATRAETAAMLSRYLGL